MVVRTIVKSNDILILSFQNMYTILNNTKLATYAHLTNTWHRLELKNPARVLIIITIINYYYKYIQRQNSPASHFIHRILASSV